MKSATKGPVSPSSAHSFSKHQPAGCKKLRTDISTRHGHLSAESQEKITNKLAKLSRFHEKLSGAQVTIDLKDESQPDVEICATVDGASRFVARATGPSLMGAVDGAVHKLEKQLTKHKSKVIDHVRDSARRNQMVDNVVNSDVGTDNVVNADDVVDATDD